MSVEREPNHLQRNMVRNGVLLSLLGLLLFAISPALGFLPGGVALGVIGVGLGVAVLGSVLVALRG